MILTLSDWIKMRAGLDVPQGDQGFDVAIDHFRNCCRRLYGMSDENIEKAVEDVESNGGVIVLSNLEKWRNTRI